MNKRNDIFIYIKGIYWVIVPFCLLGSLHYLCVFFPRLVKDENNLIQLNSHNLDYWGVVVGFFTLLVTLLVGWQIFSNIKERERIEKLTDSNTKFRNDIVSFKNSLDDRIKLLEKCCEDRKREIKNLVDAINQSVNKTSMTSNMQIGEIYKNLLLKEDKLGYRYRYISYLIQALICASRLKETKGCNLIVFDTLQTLSKIWPVEMTENSKDDLMRDLLEVENPNDIVGYDDLREVLNQIVVTENSNGL